MSKIVLLVVAGLVLTGVTTIVIFSTLQTGAPRPVATAGDSTRPPAATTAPAAAGDAAGIMPAASAWPDSPTGNATPPADAAGAARYLPFSQEVIAADPDRRRVLFFYANWCPTCRAADVDLAAKLDQLPADLTVIRVNYNDNQTDAAERELARQYGVTYQHTFVQIDGQGNEATKWNGGQVAELIGRLQ